MNHKGKLTINCLSKEASICLKGVFAVFVLLHHFQQRTMYITQPYIGKIFELMGFLSVSIFLFFSGYGLMISFYRNGKSYLNKFLINRLLPFYCINILLILLSAMNKIIVGMKITVVEMFSSLFFFETIVTYGWYIQTILIFYIVFYITFNIIDNKNISFWLMFVSVFLYIVISHLMQRAPAVYISTLSFLLGIFFGKYSDKVRVLFKYKTRTLFVSICIFLIFILSSFINTNFHNRYIFRSLSSPFFAVAILMFVEIIYEYNRKLVTNKVTRSLGKLSLEIYVSQGFFFDMFHSELIYINNNYMYIILVTICTFLFSVLIHPLFSTIYSWFRKLGRNN